MDDNEAQLLAGARQFDQQSLSQLYDQYSPRLFTYAVRRLGNVSLAEDCVADTFDRLLKELKKQRGPRNYLQAYLYRVAHNWITDFYRRTPAEEELSEEMVNPANANTANLVEDHLKMMQLRKALNCLTPIQQQTLALRYLEELSLDETAVVLQRPVGAVKALQHRALSALRKIFIRDEVLT
jgi:RNA polymerase sigma-70 factor, ECF subfamily